MCVKVTEQESTICKLKLIFVRLLYIIFDLSFTGTDGADE